MLLSMRLEYSERDGMCECSNLACSCRGQCVEDATSDIMRGGIAFGYCEACAAYALVSGAAKLAEVA